MGRGAESAHTGPAHVSAGAGGLTLLRHTLLLSTAGILIVSISEGPCEEETGDVHNMLSTYYA